MDNHSNSNAQNSSAHVQEAPERASRQPLHTIAMMAATIFTSREKPRSITDLESRDYEKAAASATGIANDLYERTEELLREYGKIDVEGEVVESSPDPNQQ